MLRRRIQFLLEPENLDLFTQVKKDWRWYCGKYLANPDVAMGGLEGDRIEVDEHIDHALDRHLHAKLAQWRYKMEEDDQAVSAWPAPAGYPQVD